jgi:hypothetical protein
MTLNDFKDKTKLKNKDLAWMFKVERHTIKRWLDDESKIPIWVKFYLNWLG